MTISWPTDPNPDVIVPKLLFPTRVSTAQSLGRQAGSQGANLYGWKASYVNLPREEFAPFGAVLAQLRGRYNTCSAILPGHEAPLGAGWGASPKVNGAQSIGAYTVNVKSLTAGQSPAVKALDLVKFSGHSKVYIVVADANSDGSGLAALAIMPALYAAVADGETITVNNVPFTVAATTDEPSWSVSSPYFANFDVDFLEVWP